MKALAIAIFLAISMSTSLAQITDPVSYTLNGNNATKKAIIQTISFTSVAGMDRTAIRRMNTALAATSNAFDKEAKKCRASAYDHPWEYKSIMEKVLLSERYLSVVFSKLSVCAGSPDIQKEARVFSLPTGDLIPPKVLLKQLFPTDIAVVGASTDKELIHLDDIMIKTMIEDSKEILKNYDSRCDFYLQNVSYHIWVDRKKLILFPEFIQPDSFCQKEYLIQINP